MASRGRGGGGPLVACASPCVRTIAVSTARILKGGIILMSEPIRVSIENLDSTNSVKVRFLIQTVHGVRKSTDEIIGAGQSSIFNVTDEQAVLVWSFPQEPF